jgi:hypothetical protein
VDGGGDGGGKTGQNTIKKSDENYDTGWGNLLEVSKNGMTVQQNAETAKSNQTHIYMSAAEIENAEQLPHADMVNQQAVDSVFAESNESFIVKDELEQVVDGLRVATRTNYGLVKIGDGFFFEGKKINVSSLALASKTVFGIVKIGSGIDESNGVIGVQPIGIATMEVFGVVKLGEDFAINENGGLEVAEIENRESVIYGLAKVKGISNGIVDLEEDIAIYRTFLNEDLVFSFDINFEPDADFSFILEIISDGEHLIDFVEEIEGVIPGLNRGITRIKFTKLLGSPRWNAEVDTLWAPEPVLLTPDNDDNIKSQFIVSCNGSTWNTYDMLGTNVGSIAFQNNPREVYFDFAKSVVVDRVYFYNNSSNVLSLFELLGSNDKISWTRLIYRSGVVINQDIATEKKGAFHYFKLRFSNEGDIRGIQLWGTVIDNDNSELFLLTPQLSSDSVAGIMISCSNVRANSVRNVTSPSANVTMELDKGTYDEPWIQYEFAESKVANFLDMASHKDELYRTARWFKLNASNDGENWDLLLERQYQEDWKQCETRYFQFENETAYKFYRLVCSYTNDGNNPSLWRISRFRLFRRESVTSSFVNCIPPLVSNTQDGYELSANSSDSGYEAFRLTDGDPDTKWATAGGQGNGAWVKIKLPEEAAFNAVYLQARNDQYYYQAPSIFKIQASNNDESWTDLTSGTASWSQKEAKIFYWLNETPYLYYRLLIEAVQSGTNAGLAQFQLGTQAETYRRYLDKYDYVVPVLTSDSDSGYVVTASSFFNDTHRPYKAFNRQTDVNSKWLTVSGGAAGAWLKIELPAAAIANAFTVASPNEGYTGRMPSSFKIQASNNDSSWVDLLSVSSLSWSGNERKSWNVDNSTAYKFYKLLFVANSESLAAIGDWGILKRYKVTEY